LLWQHFFKRNLLDKHFFFKTFALRTFYNKICSKAISYTTCSDISVLTTYVVTIFATTKFVLNITTLIVLLLSDVVIVVVAVTYSSTWVLVFFSNEKPESKAFKLTTAVIYTIVQ
jgi:hypothetical protein